MAATAISFPKPCIWRATSGFAGRQADEARLRLDHVPLLDVRAGKIRRQSARLVGRLFPVGDHGRKQWYSTIKIIEADVNLVGEPSGLPRRRAVQDPRGVLLQHQVQGSRRRLDADLDRARVKGPRAGRQRRRLGPRATRWRSRIQHDLRPLLRQLGTSAIPHVILNALAWTAHVEVPSSGVSARYSRTTKSARH